MLRTSGRITIDSTQPRKVVVADSTFELKIKGLGAIQKGNRVSDKILLMDFSDATWTITIYESGSWTFITAELHNFPAELKSKSHAELFVVYGGGEIEVWPHTGSINESKITFCCAELTKYLVNNEITLNCRLVISCECDSKLQRKYYNPVNARKALVDRYSNMFEDPTFADFTFVVRGLEFKVHMAILAAASPVMRRMFTGNMKEAKTKTCTIDAITAEIFDHMLRFIYNADLPEDVLKVAAIPLYETAHYYEIDNLKQICAQEIQESLSPVNALEVFEWAQPYDLQDLKMDAWTIIKRDILKIFVDLKNEPLSPKEINAVIKQKEQEKKFWKKLVKEDAKQVEKTS